VSATTTPPSADDGARTEASVVTLPMVDAALDAEFYIDAGGDVPAADGPFTLREMLEDEFGSTRELENAMACALKAALNSPSGNLWAMTCDRDGPR
jgi:hypothetical protein